MAATYYTLLTKIGQASIANAVALNQKVNMTFMAVGDGNGNPTTPNENQTALVREKYRASINQLTTDPDNPNYIIAEMIVPTNVGGWTVNEVGVFDDQSQLIAVANFPMTYKPQLADGSGRDLVIRIVIQVSNTSVVTLKIDPAIVLASQAWVAMNYVKKTTVAGGTTGQILAKKSNANEDFLWVDPTAAVDVNVFSREETQTLATGQTIINLAQLTTDGAAVYVEGIRLRDEQFTVNNPTRLTLATSYPGGSRVTIVQNEETSRNAFILKANNLNDLADKGAARTNLALERVEQDTTETRLWSPDRKSYVFIQNGGWGAYSVGSTPGTVALPLSSGGTGAKDAGGARTNLGLGSVATENTVPVTKGGTGATTAAAARTNLGIGNVATENTLPLSKGGTGGTTLAEARINLGVNRLVQGAVDTYITSQSDNYRLFVNDQGGWGVLNNIGTPSTLAIAQGGTGAGTAAGARANLGVGSAGTRDVGNGVATQIPDMSFFGIGATWAKLPNGLIIQWGISDAGVIGYPNTVSLPVAFSDSNFQIVACYDNAASGISNIPIMATRPAGLSGFFLMSNTPVGGNQTFARWIAIGK